MHSSQVHERTHYDDEDHYDGGGVCTMLLENYSSCNKVGWYAGGGNHL